MRDRSTWFILIALSGALALYIFARPNKQQKPTQPRVVQQQPKSPTAPPRQRLIIKKASTRTSVAPRTRVSKQEFQKRFAALRRRILDPKGGFIFQKKLLPLSLLQKQWNLKADIQAVFLQGIPRSRQYDAIQIVKPKSPTKGGYILGLQVWLGKAQSLQGRWMNQRKTYPNVRLHPKPIVGLQSFVGHRGDVHYLNVRTGSSVFSLSCHSTYCPQGKHLDVFARAIARQLP